MRVETKGEFEIYLLGVTYIGVISILSNTKKTLHQKRSFQLRISSVNVIKSAENLLKKFTEEILNGELSFFVQRKSFGKPAIFHNSLVTIIAIPM